jgi:hypothetical protein
MFFDTRAYPENPGPFQGLPSSSCSIRTASTIKEAVRLLQEERAIAVEVTNQIDPDFNKALYEIWGRVPPIPTTTAYPEKLSLLLEDNDALASQPDLMNGIVSQVTSWRNALNPLTLPVKASTEETLLRVATSGSGKVGAHLDFGPPGSIRAVFPLGSMASTIVMGGYDRIDIERMFLEYYGNNHGEHYPTSRTFSTPEFQSLAQRIKEFARDLPSFAGSTESAIIFDARYCIHQGPQNYPRGAIFLDRLLELNEPEQTLSRASFRDLTTLY